MKKGFALITVAIITAIITSLSAYFISFNTTDIRIARAHAATTRAYYLAESATALMEYKIKNDSTLRTNFINNALTKTNSTFELNNLLQTNDKITVYAISSDRGAAAIVAQGDAPLGISPAKRITKTDIGRALGGALTDYTMLTSSTDPYMMLKMDMTFNNGIVFSSKDICIYDNSTVNINNGNIWTHYSIKKSSGSTLTVTGGTILTQLPTLALPAVDFNSSNPSSWKSQATTIMPASQFDNLPDGTVLNGIIYAEGSHYLHKNLTVHGMLIINGNFEVEQNGHLVINANDGPSGLLVKQTLELETFTEIEGLVYAGKKFEIEYDNDDTPPGVLHVAINGGVMAGAVMINRDIPGPVDLSITHNAALIGRVMNAEFNLDSPTLDVGHWEDEY